MRVYMALQNKSCHGILEMIGNKVQSAYEISKYKEKFKKKQY